MRSHGRSVTAGDALIEAYRATCYRIDAPQGELKLRIDQHDAGLAQLLRDAGVATAAVLTAFNPGSELREATANAAAQARLHRELTQAGYRLLAAVNEPMDEAARAKWSEPSLLVQGITQDAALAFARRHRQQAFVWIDDAATPRLMLAAV